MGRAHETGCSKKGAMKKILSLPEGYFLTALARIMLDLVSDIK